MTRSDIVAQAREWLDDEVGGDDVGDTPYLWSTTALNRWANEAQDEACLRLRQLVDSATAEVCTIPLVDAQSSYALHASIVVVRRFEFTSAASASLPQVLLRTTFDALDQRDHRWRANTGKPCAVVQDLQARSFRLDHIPTADTLGTLSLTVWRKPLTAEQLTADGSIPVIDAQYHLHLAHWICYRAFLRKDSQTFDEKAAASHKALFQECFGTRPTAAQIQALATDDAGESTSYFF